MWFKTPFQFFQLAAKAQQWCDALFNERQLHEPWSKFRPKHRAIVESLCVCAFVCKTHILSYAYIDPSISFDHGADAGAIVSFRVFAAYGFCSTARLPRPRSAPRARGTSFVAMAIKACTAKMTPQMPAHQLKARFRQEHKSTNSVRKTSRQFPVKMTSHYPQNTLRHS